MKSFFCQIRYFLLIIAVTVNQACKEEFSPFVSEIATNSIMDFLFEEKNEFHYYIQLAEQAGLKDALDAYNPKGDNYTLFLPGNAAFEKYFAEHPVYKNIDDLLNDAGYANVLARYHVLNQEVHSTDFPFGKFPVTTLSGDILTVGHSTTFDSAQYFINNVAPISRKNIKVRNGYIHVLEEVLIPIVASSFEYIKSNPDFSIITEVFEVTNVKNKMGITTELSPGNFVDNFYTLLAEPDSIYHGEGIFSFLDLVQRVSPGQPDYTNEDNPLYQFGAYHILAGVYFLDEFEGTKNYNTFGLFPIRIGAGARVRINDDPEFQIFDTIIKGEDTTYISFLEPIYNASNKISRNGPVHFLNHVLYLYNPPLSNQRFEFREDPVISILRAKSKNHTLRHDIPLTLISWTGPDTIVYKGGSRDWIQLLDNFTISYQTPRVLPGRYRVLINPVGALSDGAIVQVYIDGKKIGGILNTTSGSLNTGVDVGSLEFIKFEPHIVTIKSILPGIFRWDYVEFEPY